MMPAVGDTTEPYTHCKSSATGDEDTGECWQSREITQGLSPFVKFIYL